jgi:hypothetical protein
LVETRDKKEAKEVESRIVKHVHGTPNPIMRQEEEVMIAAVTKALASSSNAQTIGRNGEIPLRDFFNRYLPYTFRAATGHFVPPSGRLSPQIDVMILDARYPLLAENADGSVLAMLHSVVATIEVKTRIASKDVTKMWHDAVKIMNLAQETEDYGSDCWGSIATSGFAYGCANRLDTLESAYGRSGEPEKAGLDISVLRLHTKDQTKKQPVGVEFHFEPDISDDGSEEIIGYFLTTRPMFTPLSDLYYRLVQNGYYTLGHRDYSYSDIGRHVMQYMAWSTCSWEKY